MNAKDALAVLLDINNTVFAFQKFMADIPLSFWELYAQQSNDTVPEAKKVNEALLILAEEIHAYYVENGLPEVTENCPAEEM